MTDMTPEAETVVPVLHRPETVGQIEAHGKDTYEVIWDPRRGEMWWARHVHCSPDGKLTYDPPVLQAVDEYVVAEDLAAPVLPTAESVAAPESEAPDIVVEPVPDAGDPPPVVDDPVVVKAVPERSEMDIRFNTPAEDAAEQRELLQRVRQRFVQAATFVQNNTVESREQSLALTALDEAMLWTVAAIQRRGVPA